MRLFIWKYQKKNRKFPDDFPIYAVQIDLYGKGYSGEMWVAVAEGGSFLNLVTYEEIAEHFAQGEEFMDIEGGFFRITQEEIFVTDIPDPLPSVPIRPVTYEEIAGFVDFQMSPKDLKKMN
jgi:hypothetical protein